MHQLQLPSVILAACLVGTTAFAIATPLARAQTVPPSAAERMQQDGPEEAQLKQRNRHLGCHRTIASDA
jgi:hypothetical protein